MSRHVWTGIEDALLLKMHDEETPWSKRAEALGLSVGQIKSRTERLRGVVKDAPNVVYREDEDDVQIPIHVDDEESPHASKSCVGEIPRERIETLIKLTKRGADLEELCDRMDLSPRKVRELVAEAQRLGFTVDVDGPHVGHRPAAASAEVREVRIDAAGDRRIAAGITDLHFGSRYHLGPQLRDFVALAYARGARTIICAGDVTEGKYRHAQWELTHHGFHDQANYCAETLPEHPGLTYHFITGNHDWTWAEGSGMSPGHALVEVFRSRGRNDLIFHGDRGARLALKTKASERGLVVDLWHPLKGPAYALSYALQKYIEKLSVGGKPDMVFKGHHHDAMYFNTRGIHAIGGGCFQGGSGPYGRALGGAPSIGGWIFEWAQTDGGTVRRFAPEWIGYFESERPRDVAIGA